MRNPTIQQPSGLSELQPDSQDDQAGFVAYGQATAVGIIMQTDQLPNVDNFDNVSILLLHFGRLRGKRGSYIFLFLARRKVPSVPSPQFGL